jgi:hypothetical protein
VRHIVVAARLRTGKGILDEPVATQPCRLRSIVARAVHNEEHQRG